MTRGRALGALLAVVTAFGAATFLALEGGEVVVLRTAGPPDGPRTTRTWVADEDGAAWVEAANPERAFLRQVEKTGELEMVRDGLPRRCRASVMPNPGGHARIRRLLATKYGWADRWVAMLADTSRSVAVRLSCDRPIP